MSIEDNIAAVLENMEAARVKAGTREVKLVAVTKTQPVEAINRAIRAGVTRIGENKPQELRDKLPDLLDVQMHMIGRLQRNKVKYVMGCALIHSVDSLELAGEIARQAAQRGVRQNVLIQVNVGLEDQKGGVLPDMLIKLLEGVAQMNSICVKGLMTVPPQASGEQARRYFAKLYQLAQKAKQTFKGMCFDELSMGMSGDYQQAILEGATLIRVGSAIFGQRQG